MVGDHLTDEEIQQYVLEKQATGTNINDHLANCKDCLANVKAYEILFVSLKEQQQPVFTFNLAEEVAAELLNPSSVTSKDYLSVFITFCLVIPGGIAGYIFSDYLVVLFQGMAALAIYLVAISGIIILFFFILDMFKSHQKKMQALDMI